MADIKKILVATDFSSNASQAIERAILLARQRGAQLTVMHAIETGVLAPLREFLGTDVEVLSQKIVKEAEDRLAETMAQLLAPGAVTATLHVEQGSASSSIPALANRTGVDLVLTGAHGSGFLHRMLIGSTTSRLLRKTRCPVLVVKEEAYKPYRRVLVAIDFSPASESVIRFARALTPGADLVLLHVFEVPFEGKMQYAGVPEEVILRYRIEARTRATQNLGRLAQAAGLATQDYSAMVVHGDPTRHIIEQEESLRCDLIVMGKHGTHVTEELLLGSVTKRILAESRSDMLIVVDARPAEVLAVDA